VQHLGIAEPLHHPTRGDVRVVGTPITMSRTPAKVVSPLPDPGAQTDEILRGLGYSDAEIADLRSRKIV
jgi:crotonobetainyl-CoA:carnitine CoA-transferase CaiB-like acyl-CoA transferase